MRGQPTVEKLISGAVSADYMIEPSFTLLFSVRLKGAFNGFEKPHPGVTPLLFEDSQSYTSELTEFEQKLLGKAFLETRRITRWPLGRIALNRLVTDAPAHADVYLLTHKSGVALWEVWLPELPQPFDAARWIAWLDPDAKEGLIADLWKTLSNINHEITGKTVWSGLYLPLTMLRVPHNTLDSIIDLHGADIVRLLFLDHSHRALKSSIVVEELARDYCAQQGGMTLLARRSGIDIRDSEDEVTKVAPSGSRPPKSALPFLITLELLLLEHAVLQHLYDRLSRHMPKSVEELITLKQEVIDGLEEYYGAITNASRFSDAVTADGERLLGVEDIYDAVIERLEAVSFAITTRSQRNVTLLQLWLTIIFGASEIGFIAASISTWYYSTGLFPVLAWTIGSALVSGFGLLLLLKEKVK